MALSRDKIAARAAKPELHEHHVPAWADENGDDVVFLRGLTGDEAETYQANAMQLAENVRDPKNRGLLTGLVRPCLVDENGEQLFPSEEDAAIVGKLQFRDLNGIATRILTLSGMSDEGQERIEGNSGAGQTGAQE